MFKNLFFALVTVCSSKICFFQQLVNENTYIAKNGMIFKVDDEVVLGYGSNFNKDFRLTSVADEILKLKKLLDEGVLTKKEFDTQKKKLLEKSSN